MEINNNNFKITARQPKEGDYKSVIIHGCSEKAICPLQCLKIYLKKTKEMRGNPEVTNLFITSTKPIKNATADSIRNWIQYILRKTNIEATAHTTRSVSSTAACEIGVKQQEQIGRTRILS